MRCRKSVIVLGTLMLSTLLVFWQSAFAGPPQMPGNSGLPGCLAEITELQAQIADLNNLVNQLRSQALVPRTGQTESRASGDDGALQKGAPWPNPRFTDNTDGTVTDNLTRLVWLRSANCDGGKDWYAALTFCNLLSSGACGLTDDSVAGDWRLPNVKELQSLIHYGVHDPALPDTTGTGQWSEGDPFIGVVCAVTNCNQGYYWSSTTVEGSGDGYYVYLGGGFVNETSKTHNGYLVWPVRDARK